MASVSQLHPPSQRGFSYSKNQVTQSSLNVKVSFAKKHSVLCTFKSSRDSPYESAEIPSLSSFLSKKPNDNKESSERDNRVCSHLARPSPTVIFAKNRENRTKTDTKSPIESWSISSDPYTHFNNPPRIQRKVLRTSLLIPTRKLAKSQNYSVEKIAKSDRFNDENSLIKMILRYDNSKHHHNPFLERLKLNKLRKEFHPFLTQKIDLFCATFEDLYRIETDTSPKTQAGLISAIQILTGLEVTIQKVKKSRETFSKIERLRSQIDSLSRMERTEGLPHFLESFEDTEKIVLVFEKLPCLTLPDFSQYFDPPQGQDLIDFRHKLISSVKELKKMGFKSYLILIDRPLCPVVFPALSSGVNRLDPKYKEVVGQLFEDFDRKKPELSDENLTLWELISQYLPETNSSNLDSLIMSEPEERELWPQKAAGISEFLELAGVSKASQIEAVASNKRGPVYAVFWAVLSSK